MTTLRPTITAAEVPADWIVSVAGIIAGKGYPIRPHAQYPMIEVQAKSGEWRALQLPGDGTMFDSAGDRDAVISKLK